MEIKRGTYEKSCFVSQLLDFCIFLLNIKEQGADAKLSLQAESAAAQQPGLIKVEYPGESVFLRNLEGFQLSAQPFQRFFDQRASLSFTLDA
jgi:hypothetical protein